MLLSLSLLIETSWGQDVYTLEQCRSMALSHNVEMRKAANDLQASRETSKEAFTKYFPTVSASGIGYGANKGLVEMNMTGMDLSLLKNGVMGGITATQPVFAGGQIVNSNKLAKVGAEVSALQLEQSEKEVLLTTEQYYWQVVTLREKLKTLETIEKMLDRLCRDVEVAVRAGLTTRNELLQVQLKRNDVASSKIQLENGLSVSKLILAQYVGIEESDFDIAAGYSLDEVPEFPEQLRVDHQASLSLTPEYRLLEKNVAANQLKSRLALGKNLPTVGVGAGYMYDDLMDKDHSFGVVFASVSIPISGWWGGSHAIKRQKLQLRNAKEALTDRSELLLIKMQKAWNDLEDAYKQIGIARNSIEQSSENLRLNDAYYKAGTTRMSDLLDAQSLFQQSRDKYAEVYAAYQLRKLEYLQATGR